MNKAIEIVNCTCCRPIDRDEVRYKTPIMATNCRWRLSIDSVDGLDESPQVGVSYCVELIQPVVFHCKQEFWLYYDCPKVCLNGYETEEEVMQSLFCYGIVQEIISIDEDRAVIQFFVFKTLSLDDILLQDESVNFPDFWRDLYVIFLERKEYFFQQLGKYYELCVDAQSDLGQYCVISRQGNAFYVCKVNEWSFSENYTFGTKYILPDAIKQILLNNGDLII